MCTDKSDATLLSSSNNTAVDDMSNGIKKVTLEDVDNTPPCDFISSGEEDNMNSEKKYTSCEHKIENTKTHEISHNSASNANTIDIVSGDITSDTKEVSICANCGKDGATNTCNKCKLVKYCNASCKKKHRSKHNKDCEEHLRHATKLHEEEIKRAAELYDIELFKCPPEREEDCPICFLLLPLLIMGSRYQSCCGKTICSGCIYAMDTICPFCRTPTPRSDDEVIKRTQKRADIDDAKAINCLGNHYYNGLLGLPQDRTKALELWKRSAELGHIQTLYNIGIYYRNGGGVDVDMKKAMYYYELAAMKGYASARYTLGALEQEAGNMDRALRHFMIAVESGHSGSLTNIQILYSQGQATKDDYLKALQTYQKYLVEVKSSQRDQAAAFDDRFKYL